VTEIFLEKIQKIDFLWETRSGNFQKILENRETPPILKKKFSEFFWNIRKYTYLCGVDIQTTKKL
jgi:hypothetical protein